MKIKLRAYTESDKRFIEGYASIFNVQSRLINEDQKVFREIIMRGSFDEVLKQENLNVIANIDHDMKKMLGRNVSGTLTLSVDNRGLKYVIEVPDTTVGNDIYAQVERGDYYESSFAYGSLEKDIIWDRDRKDGVLLRYIKKVSILRDVAIVRNGAFKNTDVSVRENLDYLNSIIKNVQNGEVSLCQRSTSDFEPLVDESTTKEVIAETTETEKTEDKTEEIVDETIENNETANEENAEGEDETTADAEVEESEQETEESDESSDEDDERSWEEDNDKKFLEIKTYFE